MDKWQYYTPDGMNDLLPQTMAEKRVLEEKLRTLFASMSYQEISTPGLEFYDVYAVGSLAPQEALFKLCDEQARVLALRFDGTVPTLRLAATKFSDEAFPLRLSYIQNMFRFNEGGGGRQRAFTQAGVELLGLDGPRADAEIIALAIMAARTIGLDDLQISIGQVAFTKALFLAWRLNEEAQQQLSELIDSRNMLGVEALAKELGLRQEQYGILLDYYDQPLSDEELTQLSARDLPAEAKQELDILLQVLEYLYSWGFAEYLSVDLSLLQSMNYYTGLTFKGFTYDLGFALLSGGRYDTAAAAFGKNFKATGFSIGVDIAQMALRRQGKYYQSTQRKLLLASAQEQSAELWRRAQALRQQGFATELCHQINDSRSLLELARQRAAFGTVFVDESGDVTYETLEKEEVFKP